MSTAEEIQSKQEEKKELTPDPSDKDKSNMKISLIPRVLINKSPNHDQSNELGDNDPKKESNIKEEEKINEVHQKTPEGEPCVNEEDQHKMEIEPEEKKEEEKEEKKD